MRADYYPAGDCHTGDHYPDLQDPGHFEYDPGLLFGGDELDQPQVLVDPVGGAGYFGLN